MKIYNFEKKIINEGAKILTIILYFIITIMTCGIFLLITNLNEFIDHSCTQYYFADNENLYKVEEDIIRNINKDKNIEALFLINDTIEFLKHKIKDL